MSSKYRMYLTANNEGQRIVFPILPEKISISSGSKNESVDVVGLGEVTIFQDQPAAQIAFDGELPADLCDGYSIADTIVEWKSMKKPVHLIVTGTSINLYCSIENFSYEERGGDVGTVYFSISLKEYRTPGVRKISISDSGKATVSKSSTRIDNRTPDKTYTVKSGDCLYNIAKAKLGDPSRWPEIASLNGIKSPYTIFTNNVLKLPE